MVYVIIIRVPLKQGPVHHLDLAFDFSVVSSGSNRHRHLNAHSGAYRPTDNRYPRCTETENCDSLPWWVLLGDG
jgi:hypothetical protein